MRNVLEVEPSELAQFDINESAIGWCSPLRIKMEMIRIEEPFERHTASRALFRLAAWWTIGFWQAFRT